MTLNSSFPENFFTLFQFTACQLGFNLGFIVHLGFIYLFLLLFLFEPKAFNKQKTVK